MSNVNNNVETNVENFEIIDFPHLEDDVDFDNHVENDLSDEEIMEVKKEMIENNVFASEAIKVVKERQSKVSSLMNKRVYDIIKDIYHYKNNPDGISAEMAFCKIVEMKGVATFDEDGQLYVYDEDEMFFKRGNVDNLESVISRIACEFVGLGKYIKSKFFNSVAETIMINMRSNSSYTKFKRGSFAIDVVDRTGMKHTLSMRLMNHKEKGLIYICEKTLPSHKINFKIFSNLNIDNFLDHKGFEFELGKQYYYIPKCDRSSPFFKYFMNNMYTHKCFEMIEKNYYGAVLNGFEMQTSLLRLGHGRNGKGLRSRADKMLFNGRHYSQIAIVDYNTDDKSKFFAINKMRWLLTNEIKKEGFLESFFKMINGKDSLPVRGLYQNMNADGIKPDDNAGIILNANYNDLFILSDQGLSMQERITPIETANAIEIVEGLFDVLIEGGTITAEKFCKEYNKGEAIIVTEKEASMSLTNYVDWMLEGGIEFKNRNKRMASENYGERAIEFKNAVMNKMSGSADTFEELELVMVEEGYGCSTKELYEIFIKTMNRDRKSYSLIKFVKELGVNYKKAFGEDLPFINDDKRAFCKNYDSNGRPLMNDSGTDFIRTHSRIVGVAFYNMKCELHKPCGKRSTANKIQYTQETQEVKDAEKYFGIAKDGE